jgi:hypothetical protein
MHFPSVRAWDNSRRRGVPAKTDQLHNEAAGSKCFLLYNKKGIDMNTIPSSPKGDLNIELTSSERIQESIYPYQHEVNITDGGEFLDDAIRTKEQPLGETTVKGDELAFTIAFYQQHS